MINSEQMDTTSAPKKPIEKMIYVIAWMAIILISSCNIIDNSDSDKELTIEGSLFIIGGGSRPNEMMVRMIKESGLDKGGYAVILPMSSELPDSAIIWSSEQFIKNGVHNIVGFNFTKDLIPPNDWIDSLKNANLIYISGGNQNRFMEIVKGTKIEKAIHFAYEHGAMIAGTSAGAAVMSHVMITGNELRTPEYRPTFRTIEAHNLETSEGLGLLSTAIIDQHFIWRSRHNRLFSAVIEFPHLTGIGIDESTAILIRNNTVEVVGVSQVMVFENPDNSYIEKNSKLAARNLRIDIYHPGEKFELR
jgi:cyanophycinase